MLLPYDSLSRTSYRATKVNAMGHMSGTTLLTYSVAPKDSGATIKPLFKLGRL